MSSVKVATGITMRGRGVCAGRRPGKPRRYDNSGGVDPPTTRSSSPASPYCGGGKSHAEDRVRLLADVGDWVCGEFKNNASQVLAISLDEQRSHRTFGMSSTRWISSGATWILTLRAATFRDPSNPQRSTDRGLFSVTRARWLLSYSKMFAFEQIHHPIGSKD